MFIELSLSALSSEEIERQLRISLGGEFVKGRWRLIKEMSNENPDPKMEGRVYSWRSSFLHGRSKNKREL